MGLIDYNGHLEVQSALLNVVLRTAHQQVSNFEPIFAVVRAGCRSVRRVKKMPPFSYEVHEMAYLALGPARVVSDLAPASMTLMGGPIDTRRSPTKVIFWRRSVAARDLSNIASARFPLDIPRRDGMSIRAFCNSLASWR